MGNSDYNWSVATLNLHHPLREGYYIKARGIFAKIYPYQSRKNEWHWAPLIVSPNLQKIKRENKKASLWQYVVVTIFLLGVIAVIYYGTKHEDERRTRARQKIIDRRNIRDANKIGIKSKDQINTETPTPNQEETS